jgi:HSP20 family protein
MEKMNSNDIQVIQSSRFDFSSNEGLPFSVAHLAGWRLSAHPAAWRPPTDVYETEDAYVVKMEIAGMREEDISVQIDGRNLSVRGVRSDSPERKAFHLMEIRVGEFQNEIELPGAVIPGEISAIYREGFLVIHLPKVSARHIQIEE